jgi:hypothetical protein
MGKTVFLREAQDRFVARGWLCGYYEVRRNDNAGVAVAQIIADTYESVGGASWFHKLVAKSPIRLGSATLSALGTGLSLEVDSGGRADPFRDLASLLVKLGNKAADQGVGVVLLIDEFQQFRKADLEVVLQVSRRLEGLPIAIVGAGLPTLPEIASEAGTYSERFSFEPIDRLHPREAESALVEPAAQFSVSFAPTVLSEILRRSDGYPYFLQLYASEVWRAAGNPSDAPGTTLTKAHLRVAVEEVQRKADSGLYRARYERASDAEQSYLKAMARLGDSGISSGAVAEALGKTLAQLSTTRDRLITKGVIHAPRSGKLDFSVPGFGDYVRRRALEDE